MNELHTKAVEAMERAIQDYRKWIDSHSIEEPEFFSCHEHDLAVLISVQETLLKDSDRVSEMLAKQDTCVRDSIPEEVWAFIEADSEDREVS